LINVAILQFEIPGYSWEKSICKSWVVERHKVYLPRMGTGVIAKKIKKISEKEVLFLLNIIIYRILLDTSPDLRFQLLDNNISDLDCVFFTHSHADHISGINELRSFYIKKNKKLIFTPLKNAYCRFKKCFLIYLKVAITIPRY